MQEIIFELVKRTKRIIVGSYCKDKVGKPPIRSLCILVSCLLAVQKRLDLWLSRVRKDNPANWYNISIHWLGGENSPPFTQI